MAPAPKKKNVAARAVTATTKSALVKAIDKGLVASRAAFVTPETLAEEVESAVAPMAEVQENFRNALEKSAIDPRAAFARAKTAADEAASALEVSFAAAKDGAVAIHAKAFDSAARQCGRELRIPEGGVRGEVAPRSHHPAD